MRIDDLFEAYGGYPFEQQWGNPDRQDMGYQTDNEIPMLMGASPIDDELYRRMAQWQAERDRGDNINIPYFAEANSNPNRQSASEGYGSDGYTVNRPENYHSAAADYDVGPPGTRLDEGGWEKLPIVEYKGPKTPAEQAEWNKLTNNGQRTVYSPESMAGQSGYFQQRWQGTQEDPRMADWPKRDPFVPVDPSAAQGREIPQYMEGEGANIITRAMLDRSGPSPDPVDILKTKLADIKSEVESLPEPPRINWLLLEKLQNEYGPYEGLQRYRTDGAVADPDFDMIDLLDIALYGPRQLFNLGKMGVSGGLRLLKTLGK